ncbi:MAG: hypothetical protein SNH01_07665 [Rikenellaceae bacterium]
MKNIRDIFRVIFCFAIVLSAFVSCDKGDSDPEFSEDDELVYFKFNTDGIEDAEVGTKGALTDNGYLSSLTFKWDHQQDMLLTIDNENATNPELAKFKDYSGSVARYSTVNVDAGGEGTQSKSAILTPSFGMTNSNYKLMSSAAKAYMVSPVTESDFYSTPTSKLFEVKLKMPTSPMTVTINSADHLQDYLYVYSEGELDGGSYDTSTLTYTFATDYAFKIIPAFLRIYVYNTTGYKLKIDRIRIAVTGDSGNGEFHPAEAILRTRTTDDTWSVYYDADVARYADFYIVPQEADGSSPVLENNSYFTTYLPTLPDEKNYLAASQLKFRIRLYDEDGNVSAYMTPASLTCNNLKYTDSFPTSEGNANFVSGSYYDVHMNITSTDFEAVAGYDSFIMD